MSLLSFIHSPFSIKNPTFNIPQTNTMPIKRRTFIGLTALATTGAISGFRSMAAGKAAQAANTASMLKDVEPITVDERKSRIAKAQKLLAENNIKALILDSGTSLEYFTGISWWPSERTMVAVITAEGDVKYVCPAFEEARFRELITIGKDVYVWQEDESPYKQIVRLLKDSGVTSGKIGIEERVRFFIMDGVRKEAPQFEFVSGDPVTMPCRMIKSPAEIALMQKASNITIAAIKYGVSMMHVGMTQGELAGLIAKAHDDAGGSGGGGLCLFGTSSAFPHGSRQPQKLQKGDIVLMDCGCTVEGYHSDITRTIVFGGEPTKRQEQIWNLERDAQAAGFAAAKLGDPCENVDAAARKVITDAGFGPNYQVPGLPHRTGHGIGMDGHEWGNMVRGNKQLLQPGMCFSVEPTISIPGEFGIRFEDCVYMTEQGPKWFTTPPVKISAPFA